MIAFDMLGKMLSPGDHVLDERGQRYLVLATEPSFIREGLIRAGRLPATKNVTALRLAHIMRVERDLVLPDARTARDLYHTAYENYVRPRQRAALRRRKEITGPPRHARKEERP